MTTLFKNGTVFTPRGIRKRETVFVSNGKVFVNSLSSLNIESADSVVDCTGKVIVPGFTDVTCAFA